MANPGDIYYADFPYDDIPSCTDCRPILILFEEQIEGEKLYKACKITTQPKQWIHKYQIKNLAPTGLHRQSYVVLDSQHQFFANELLNKNYLGTMDLAEFWGLLQRLAEIYL